jgi:hypothetical protein
MLLRAWVVYSFVFLLIAFLGGADKHLQVRLFLLPPCYGETSFERV